MTANNYDDSIDSIDRSFLSPRDGLLVVNFDPAAFPKLSTIMVVSATEPPFFLVHGRAGKKKSSKSNFSQFVSQKRANKSLFVSLVVLIQ